MVRPRRAGADAGCDRPAHERRDQRPAGLSELETTLRNDGALAAPTTPEAFGAQIVSEIAAWREVIRRAGITGGG